MTIEEALRHAGDLERVSVEEMDEIVRYMPGYLWIVDNYAGDVGLPEYDEPARGQRARLIHCGVCDGSEVQETHHGRYRVKYVHNDGVVCPFCGETVVVKHVSRGIKGLRDQLDAVIYRKSAVDPKTLVVVAYHCERPYALADVNEPWELQPVADARGVAVFDAVAHDSIRIQTRPVYKEDCFGRYGLMWKAVKSMHAMTFGNSGLFAWQKPDRAALTESFERAIRDTPFVRAWHVDYWCGRDGIEALNMIARYPCVEYLTKLGLTGFLKAELRGELPARTVTWNGDSMSRVLGLSKARLGELKGKKIFITPMLCAVLQIADRDRVRCSAEVAEGVAIACRDDRSGLKEKLRAALARFPVERRPKALKFIAANRDRHFGDIVDLWQMVTYTGGSLAVGDDAFPKDFRAAHDRLAARVDVKDSEKLNDKIAKRLPALTKKYGFEFGGLILRPAKSATEIVREGQALHHCVGGYVNKYANGATVICVLRRAVEPDTPWRTVEISAKTGEVVQDRGLHNDWGKYTIDDSYRAMLAMFWEAWRERDARRERKSA